MKLVDTLNKIMEQQRQVSELHVWITPDNEAVKVGDHLQYIKQLYHDPRPGLEGDEELHEKAFKDGWAKVNVTDINNHSEISIASLNKKKGAIVMQLIFSNIILKHRPAHIMFFTERPYNTYEFWTGTSSELFRIKRFIEKNS